MKQITSLLSMTLAIALSLTPALAAPTTTATDILRATGVEGGVVVHLGCGEGKLTAALHAGDAFLVHGLDVNAANVAIARQRIPLPVLGGGTVSFDRLTDKNLPYVDNMVNLLVVENAAAETRVKRINKKGIVDKRGGVLSSKPEKMYDKGGVLTSKDVKGDETEEIKEEGIENVSQ